MKKIVRLNEKQFTKMIGKIVSEAKNKKKINEMENFINPEAMETANAIYTIIGTVIGLLGVAGYDYLLELAKGLMDNGKEKEAQEILDFVSENNPGNGDMMGIDNENKMDMNDNFENMTESTRIKTRKFPRK
jgi:hypothetical protein